MKLEALNIEQCKLPIEDIKSGLSDDDRGPFQNVFLLECEYMNLLITTIINSLSDLALALDGQLAMSDRLETLYEQIYQDKIPDTWTKVAYPSERGLGSWIDNLKLRAN